MTEMPAYSAKYSQLVMPDHINVVGTLFGGQMIAWVDLAAGKAAFRFLRCADDDSSVTRAIEKVEFKEPVYLGEWVNFTSTVISAGKTSFTIEVEAHAEGRKTESRLACFATVVMVSVKEDTKGNYQKVPHGKSC